MREHCWHERTVAFNHHRVCCFCGGTETEKLKREPVHKIDRHGEHHPRYVFDKFEAMIVGIKTDTGESVMSCKYPCPVERDSEGLPEKNEERKYEIKFSIPPTNKDGTCDTDCPLWRMTADTAGCALEYDDDACRPSGECPRKAQK